MDEVREIQKDYENMSRNELITEMKKRTLKIPYQPSLKQLRAILKGEIEPPTKEEKRKTKKSRIPLGRMRAKLSIDNYDIPKDKVARWINDKPGRLRAAEEGGYTFVNDPEAKIGEEPLSGRNSLESNVSRTVGTHEDGSPMTAYLMVIDKDLYEQDQAEKQAVVDETDEAIKGGKLQETADEKRYVPPGGIVIKSNIGG